MHQLQVSQPCWLSFQVPTATSQQMDDLFDILIESGGKEVHADGTNPEHCVQCEQVLNNTQQTVSGNH